MKLFISIIILAGLLVGCASVYHPPDPNSPEGIYYAQAQKSIDEIWREIIKEKIRAYYKEGHVVDAKENPKMLIELVISKVGEILSETLIQSSGLDPLDQAGLEALKVGRKIPKPDEKVLNFNGKLKIRWQFILQV